MSVKPLLRQILSRRALTGLLALGLLISLPAQAVTLKIATISPEGTSWMVKMRAASKQVQQETQGRVKFRFYPGGVMGNDQSVLRKIRIGQLHGGAVTGGSLAGIFPDNQIYALPFLFDNQQEVDYIRSKMDPVLVEGLADKGFITFGLAEGGFAYLMSNQPLRDMATIQAQKVWIPDGDNLANAVFSQAGVSPVNLPISDVLTGLQTGLIDTVTSSPIGAIALQWHTRVRYLTDSPLTYFHAQLVVSKKAFNRIKPADQAVVRRIMSETFVAIDEQNRKDNRDAREALKAQGITFVQPTPATLKQWHQIRDTSLNAPEITGLYSAGVLQQLLDHLGRFRSGQATAQR